MAPACRAMDDRDVSLTYLTIHGERCVTLAGLAEVYEVEFSFVAEVYEFGLLGEGRRADAPDRDDAPDEALADIAVAAEMLDRMAAICRWHRLAGLDLAGIALLLEPEPEAP